MADEFDNYPPETLIELGKLSLKLARGKDTRRDFLKTVKKIDPNYMLPGDQQVQDLRTEMEDRDAARELKAATDASNARLEKQRQGLLDGTLLPGRKFDADQVKEIEEKVMPKYGISDYEAAAKIYASDLKPAKPSGKQPNGSNANWSFPDLPGLMDDPAKAAREAAHQVIDELHSVH
jgi:hypothetical protein